MILDYECYALLWITSNNGVFCEFFVPTHGTDLSSGSTSGVIDLFSSPDVVKQITSITIEPGVEVEVTIADS
ncbi:hypothetical protein BUALT_BualtUnG0061000 [Buddleja alternifolia]|uniref:Uncharacterized protein n=1 Tax=Buddleja alternifolia TaxID=168488 RepID=A0AAV6W382_9LAMI|nr:hypothetical protein BUALT_BualtUnG0061000 [Buddleja alternifolia]